MSSVGASLTRTRKNDVGDHLCQCRRPRQVLKALEALKVGDDLRVTVFRDDKVVELTAKFTGF